MGKNEYLLRAAEGGYIKGVTEFLRPKWFGLIKPADVNTRGRDQFTPLIFAAQKGNLDIATLLIERGADVNAKSNQSFTPLMASSEGGHQKIVTLLLEHGAEVDALKTGEDPGWTPLLFAAVKGHKGIVKILVEKGAAVNGRAQNDFTPLMACAKFGYKEILSYLLEHGADVNISLGGKDKGWTALMFAAWQGHTEIVRILIEKGAQVDVVSADLWTPLMCAVDEGHREVVTLLLKHGAQAELTGRENWTPLLLAARSGHQDIMELIFNQGVSLNLKQKDGYTALMLAAHNGHMQAVQFLIDHGADIHCMDHSNKNALAIALKKNHKDIADLLLKHGAQRPARKRNVLPEITDKQLSIQLVDSQMLGNAGLGGPDFQNAIQSLNNGNNDEAARFFTKAIEKGLDALRLGYAYANLGTIKLKKKNLIGAIEDLITVLNYEQALYESVHDAVQYLYIIYSELDHPSEAQGLQQLYSLTSAKLGTWLAPDMAEKVKQLVKKEKNKFLPIKKEQ